MQQQTTFLLSDPSSVAYINQILWPPSKLFMHAWSNNNWILLCIILKDLLFLPNIIDCLKINMYVPQGFKCLNIPLPRCLTYCYSNVWAHSSMKNEYLYLYDASFLVCCSEAHKLFLYNYIVPNVRYKDAHYVILISVLVETNVKYSNLTSGFLFINSSLR